MSRPNSGEVPFLLPHATSAALTLTLQLKRESLGSRDTVTIRPGGLSWRLSEPIESHKCALDALAALSRNLIRFRAGSPPRPNHWMTSGANLTSSTPA